VLRLTQNINLAPLNCITAGGIGISASSRQDTINFKNNNKAANAVKRNEVRLNRRTNKALMNAYRLQDIGKRKEFGRNVAEVYEIDALSRYVRIEFAILAICLIITVLSLVMVFLGSPVFLTWTVIFAWVASIAYRLFKIHRKCLWHLIEVATQPCPYCGKAVDSKAIADHLALTNQVRH
jgi:hypothetical protein